MSASDGILGGGSSFSACLIAASILRAVVVCCALSSTSFSSMPSMRPFCARGTEQPSAPGKGAGPARLVSHNARPGPFFWSPRGGAGVPPAGECGGGVGCPRLPSSSAAAACGQCRGAFRGQGRSCAAALSRRSLAGAAAAAAHNLHHLIHGRLELALRRSPPPGGLQHGRLARRHLQLLRHVEHCRQHHIVRPLPRSVALARHLEAQLLQVELRERPALLRAGQRGRE
eukprot:543644-Prymnesium_polylepis.1